MAPINTSKSPAIFGKFANPIQGVVHGLKGVTDIKYGTTWVDFNLLGSHYTVTLIEKDKDMEIMYRNRLVKDKATGHRGLVDRVNIDGSLSVRFREGVRNRKPHEVEIFESDDALRKDEQSPKDKKD